MRMRGKVLRAPGNGPGLLIGEGQQYRFSTKGVWKSEMPPRPGLDVEVELDEHLQVLAITVLPGAQFGKERAEASIAKDKQKRGKIFGKIVAQCGTRLGLRSIFKRLEGNMKNGKIPVLLLVLCLGTGLASAAVLSGTISVSPNARIFGGSWRHG